MYRAVDYLNHIGIMVTEEDGNFKSFKKIMDEIIVKWSDLNDDQKYDLSFELLDN